MNVFLKAQLIALVLSSTSYAAEYWLVAFDDLLPPRLCDGYEPTAPEADRLLDPCLEFAVDHRREESARRQISVMEVTEQFTMERTDKSKVGASFKAYVTAKMSTEDYERLFRESSMFVVSVHYITRNDIPKIESLNVNVADFNKKSFRKAHGPRVVSRIDYGGYLYLVYIFNTVDRTLKSKIMASLDAAYKGGKADASVESELMTRLIRTEYTVDLIQDGGSGTLFTKNAADLGAFLKEWEPTIADEAVPVRFFTSPYSKLASDIPWAYPDIGFGDIRIETE